MQGNLLDTHTLIWFLNGDADLSVIAKKAIEEEGVNYISIASLWEMSIIISLNKLKINTPFICWVQYLLKMDLRFYQLPFRIR